MALATNNELYLRLVKGWVAKTIKGLKIKWVEATAVIIREKARCINIGPLPRVHSSHNSD
jgi:hypothetical protein